MDSDSESGSVTPSESSSLEGHNIKKATSFITSNGFRSTNDFIVGFYRSSEGAASLRYYEGKAFALERVLDAWIDSMPSEAARSKLHMVIAEKAADIMVKESSAAIRDP